MIQNTTRPRGRPRTFDEGWALEKATQVFRSKGYDGVTIDDLVAGMGVGRPSLYAVFGDKRTLFLRVLRAYAEKKGALAAKALFSPEALRGEEGRSRCEGTLLAGGPSRLARQLPEADRRDCDRGRIRRGLSTPLRRAACGRRRGPAVRTERCGWR